MEKSNVYSLMTRLKNQSHLRVPAAPEKPQKAKIQSAGIHVTPSLLKRVQTPAVMKTGQIGNQLNSFKPLAYHYKHKPAIPTSSDRPTVESDLSDPALTALQDDFKELTELHQRLHFMLKDLESILESEK